MIKTLTRLIACSVLLILGGCAHYHGHHHSHARSYADNERYRCQHHRSCHSRHQSRCCAGEHYHWQDGYILPEQTNHIRY